MEEKDEFLGGSRGNLFWGLISAALLSGLGSGVFTVTQTGDRYTGQDADRDFRSRDIEIQHLREDYRDLRARIQRLDDLPPPPSITKQLSDHEERLRDLEKAK